MVSCAKMAELIDVPFSIDSGGSKEPRIGGADPNGKRQF